MSTIVADLFRNFSSSATLAEPAARPVLAESLELAQLRNEVKAMRGSQAYIQFEIDGTIIDANPQFLDAVGYSLEEIQGKHHRIFVKPEEAASDTYQMFWEHLAKGKHLRGEFERVDKSGNTVWINATYTPVTNEHGEPVRVIKYLFDITGLKEQESDASRLLSMIESMPIAVMYVDRELVVQYANPASIEILKRIEHALPISANELVGTCIDRFHRNPEHQRRLLSDPSNLPITTQIELGGETLSFSVSAILDSTGKYVGAMASGRIMTEEVRTKTKASEVGTSVATTVTDMAASIDEISRSVSRTASLAKEAEGMATLTETHVNELKDSSQQINEVVGVIQEFADQTNLLALNATIEAARAGENGRSFAVVASEVKDLASETAKAANRISESVKLIRESIDKVVDSTKQITQGIGEVSANTTTVASAIEEQSLTMSNLGERASELKEITS